MKYNKYFINFLPLEFSSILIQACFQVIKKCKKLLSENKSILYLYFNINKHIRRVYTCIKHVNRVTYTNSILFDTE